MRNPSRTIQLSLPRPGSATTSSDAPTSSASSSWSRLESVSCPNPVLDWSTTALALSWPSMVALDDAIHANATRICMLEREIAAADYTRDALVAARPPRLFRKRHAVRLAVAEAECAALEAQHAELYTAHSAMWTRWNARVSPLCRLPLELVARILDHVAPFDLPHNHVVEWPDESEGWEPAMLVCTYLRAAALSSPALWGRITDANRKVWSKVYMGRAGALPLSISIKITRPALLIWSLGGCTRPIHHARIFLHHKDDDSHILHTRWMPHLRSLVYWICANSWQPRARVSQAWLGAALTELVLHGVELVTDGLRLPHLVRLELQDVWVEDGLPNLLRLVGTATGLVFLFLDPTHVSEFDDSGSVEPITLPSLETSCVDGSPDHVLTMIRALPAPENLYQITSRIITHDDARHGLLAEVSSWRDSVLTLCLNREAERPSSAVSMDWVSERSRRYHAPSRLSFTYPRIPNAPAVHYTSMLDSAPLLLATLHDARSLRLGANFETLLVDAVSEPLGPLGTVEDLALPDAWAPAVQDALRGWLRARAAAGRPVGKVDCLGACSLVYVEDLRALRMLAKEMLKEGWVDEVLHDGWTVSRETYMPADV